MISLTEMELSPIEKVDFTKSTEIKYKNTNNNSFFEYFQITGNNCFSKYM